MYKPDDSIMYLHSHVVESPPTQIATLLPSIQPYLTRVSAYTNLIGREIDQIPNSSATLSLIFHEIYGMCAQIYTECEGLFNKQSPFENYTEQTLLEFRRRTLPLAENVLTLVGQLREFNEKIPAIFDSIESDEPTWVWKQAHKMWSIIEVMTTLNFQIPVYITHWNSISDHVTNLAHQGNREAIPALLEALENPVPEIRSTAVILLKFVKDDLALIRLVQALDDPDKDVRSRVTHVLGDIGDHRAVEPLIKRLTNSNDERRDAIFALSRIPDERALQPLLDVLKEETEGETLPIPISRRNGICTVLCRALRAIGGDIADAAIKHYFGNDES